MKTSRLRAVLALEIEACLMRIRCGRRMGKESLIPDSLQRKEYSSRVNQQSAIRRPLVSNSD